MIENDILVLKELCGFVQQGEILKNQASPVEHPYIKRSRDIFIVVSAVIKHQNVVMAEHTQSCK